VLVAFVGSGKLAEVNANQWFLLKVLWRFKCVCVCVCVCVV